MHVCNSVWLVGVDCSVCRQDSRFMIIISSNCNMYHNNSKKMITHQWSRCASGRFLTVKGQQETGLDNNRVFGVMATTVQSQRK